MISSEAQTQLPHSYQAFRSLAVVHTTGKNKVSSCNFSVEPTALESPSGNLNVSAVAHGGPPQYAQRRTLAALVLVRHRPLAGQRLRAYVRGRDGSIRHELELATAMRSLGQLPPIGVGRWSVRPDLSQIVAVKRPTTNMTTEVDDHHFSSLVHV